MKVFDLNRDESALLMGGVASPMLKRLQNQTLLRVFPPWLARRFSPSAYPGGDSRYSLAAGPLDGTAEPVTFSRIIKQVVLRRAN